MKTILNYSIAKSIAPALALLWALTAGMTGNVFAQDHGGHEGHAHSTGAEPEDHGKHESESAEMAVQPADHSDSHEGHNEHEEDDSGLHLTAKQRKQFGIEMREAGPGRLVKEASMPGEIVFNQDQLVHMVPRVAGIVEAVHKSLGDSVAKGEVLAVIESPELAEAKSDLLASRARAELAEKNYEREEALYRKEITSEQEFIESKALVSEARIAEQLARQKLRAMGLSNEAIEAIPADSFEDLTTYKLLAPLDGVVVRRDVSRGEIVASDAAIFTVADLSSVWIDLSIHARNLAAVKEGDELVLRLEHGGAETRAKIAMVTPFVEKGTRAAIARVLLSNPGRGWRPGSFVTGFIESAEENLPVVIERDAVQRLEGRDVVFTRDGEDFVPTPVVTGRKDRQRVEIVSGLASGRQYAARGAFEIKAAIVTSGMGSHAGHGH